MYEAPNRFASRSTWPGPIVGQFVVIGKEDRNKSAGQPDKFETLILAVATRQDREAFAVLFKHFGPRLKTFFLRAGLAAGSADELVQETMLLVWRKAGYYDPDRAAVSTWLFTIARNLRIDFARRQRDPASLPPDPVFTPASVEDLLMSAERDERVRRALSQLSPEQQTIIRLSFYIDLSQSEIAEDLGIPLGTVKSRIRLAMKRLRAVLDDNA